MKKYIAVVCMLALCAAVFSQSAPPLPPGAGSGWPPPLPGSGFQSGQSESMELESEPPPPPGGGSGGTNGGVGLSGYSTPGLKLYHPQFEGGNLRFWILEAQTNAAYDLFLTTELASSPTNISWFYWGRTEDGQTNFVAPNPGTTNAFFLLGTMADSDGDGLTDAFEKLVTKTSAALADSNTNGVSDAYEDSNSNGVPNYVEAILLVRPTVFASVPQASEGGLPGMFTVILPYVAATNTTVRLNLEGSAVYGEDYVMQLADTTAVYDHVTVPAGTNMVNVIVYPTEDDEQVGYDRDVALSVFNEISVFTYEPVATVAIIEDDVPEVSVSATASVAREKASPTASDYGVFAVSRKGRQDTSLTVYLTVTGSAINGTDYEQIAGSVVIPSGTNQVFVEVRPLNDSAVEGTETAQLTLAANSAYAVGMAGSASVSIVDDELPVVEVIVTDSDARESGSNPGQVKFTRTGATNQSLTIPYAVSGTALGGVVNYTSGGITLVSDYEPITGEVVIPAGATNVTVDIVPANDTELETIETVVFTIKGSDNYRMGSNNTGTVYIDDNHTTSYTHALTKATAAAGTVSGSLVESPGEVVITRWGTSRTSAEFSYEMYTPQGQVLGTQYYGMSGDVNVPQKKVLFAANQAKATVRVHAPPGTYPTQTGVNLYVGLPQPLNSYPIYFTGADTMIGVEVLERVGIEGGQKPKIRFSRPLGSTKSFTVFYSIGGEATPGTDHNFTTSSFAFPASVLTTDVEITVSTDAVTEGWEALTVKLDKTQVQFSPDTRTNKATMAQLYIGDAGLSTTNAPAADTDGDGLTDAFEVANASLGLSQYVANDPFADNDRDGLDLFAEQAAGTSPSSTNTDDDAFDDLAEFIVGGTAATDVNAGPAAEEDLVRISFTVSSCFQCHGTALKVGEYSLANKPPGSITAGQVVKLLRGKSYPIRIHPVALANPYPTVTNGTYSAQIAAAVPGESGVIIKDPDQILGTDRPVTTSLRNKSATLILRKLEVKFGSTNDWSDLSPTHVVVDDQELRVKIKVTPKIDTLASFLAEPGMNSLVLKTTATLPAGATVTLTTGNTTLVQGANDSELRVSFTRAQLQTMGLVPSANEDGIEEKSWLDSGDTDPAAASNLSDGQAFDAGVAGVLRGKAHFPPNLAATPPVSQPDDSFFLAGGVEYVTASVQGFTSERRQVMNQADTFYYSGHGNHADGALLGGANATKAAAYWNRDLNLAIIAGCSVLDVNDYNNNYVAAGHNAAPGKLWATIGPSLLLGYNYVAPLDNQGSERIIKGWIANRGALSDVESWRKANDNRNGRNACAINVGIGYYYFQRKPGRIGNNYEWVFVPVAQW